MTLFHALTEKVARDLSSGMCPKKVTMSERAYLQLADELRKRDPVRNDVRHKAFLPKSIVFDVPGFLVKPDVEIAFSRLIADEKFLVDYVPPPKIEEEDPEWWRHSDEVRNVPKKSL